MGCDIHFKGYLYDNNTKDYIDIDIINKNIGLDMQFPILVGYRNYDLFGLFGNEFRSDFPRLVELNDGCPDWFEKKDPGDFNDHDYYGFTYSDILNISKMLKKYKKDMNKGNIFLLNNKEEIANHLKRLYYTDIQGFYNNNTRVECLSFEIDNILKKINDYYKISKNPKFKILCDLNGYEFDIDKTVFIFWFDN